MVDLQGEKSILKPTEKKGEKCLDLETMNGLQTIQYSNGMSEKSNHMLVRTYSRVLDWLHVTT